MRLYIIFPLLFLGACQKEPQKQQDEHKMSVKNYPYLEPSDLNIQKRRFSATPKSNEVAIFRYEEESKLKPSQHKVYDQIMWTNGKEAHIDVVIAPLSFYLDYPESETEDPETFFRDSWRLQAGLAGYVIKDYTFLRSNWTFSQLKAEGSVVYTKKNRTKSEDLVFKFSMFILSLEEAKKLHPKLDIERDQKTYSWEAAFLVEPKQTEPQR